MCSGNLQVPKLLGLDGKISKNATENGFRGNNRSGKLQI